MSREERTERIFRALTEFLSQPIGARIINPATIPGLTDLLSDICETAIDIGRSETRNEFALSAFQGITPKNRDTILSLLTCVSDGDEDAAQVLADAALEMGLLPSILKAWARASSAPAAWVPRYDRYDPVVPIPPIRLSESPTMSALEEMLGLLPMPDNNDP